MNFINRENEDMPTGAAQSHELPMMEKSVADGLAARVEQLEREQLIIARTYDPNCDEYHFTDEQVKMVAARQTIESVQELAVYLGRDPEGCLVDVADDAMGKIETLTSQLAAAEYYKTAWRLADDVVRAVLLARDAAMAEVERLLLDGHGTVVDRARQPSLIELAQKLAGQRDAARAEVERWKQQAFRPFGDNHHNAKLCPHCNPTPNPEAE